MILPMVSGAMNGVIMLIENELVACVVCAVVSVVFVVYRVG